MASLFFSCGWGQEGAGGSFFFQVAFGVESGDCTLFTFHLDSGQSTFHACFGRGRGVGFQSKEFSSS